MNYQEFKTLETEFLMGIGSSTYVIQNKINDITIVLNNFDSIEREFNKLKSLVIGLEKLRKEEEYINY